MDTLKSLTEELLALTEEAEQYYIEVVKQDPTYEVDFHNRVKPFADKVQPKAAAWLPIAKAFLLKTDPRDLHVSQLEQTVENLDVVAIKSFYPSSGMKRQRETFKSVRYVLSSLLAEMERAASEQ
ncbi:YppE family protein [Shouchella tritolerans]|uniref:YppE family protein n=1 Tax=Shouchella tritolerans TaxID=2979466 RepID=UPI00078879BB|nr:YppE family protein [Shouchella tritolerans]